MRKLNSKQLPAAFPKREQKAPRSTLEVLTPLLAFITTIFGIVSPLLIVLNYQFTEGYVSALGLDADLYSRSPDQHLVKSFGAIINVLNVYFPSYSSWIAWLLGILFIIVLTIWIHYFFNPRIPTPKFLDRHISRLWENKRLERAWLRSVLALLVTYVLIVAPLSIAVLLVSLWLPVSNAGASTAYGAISKFNAEGQCEKQMKETKVRPCVCVVPKKEGRPFEGLLLIASEKSVAIYDPALNMVRSLHPKDGVEIRTTFSRSTEGTGSSTSKCEDSVGKT